MTMKGFKIWLEGTNYTEATKIQARGYKGAVRMAFKDHITPPVNTTMRVLVEQQHAPFNTRIFTVNFGQRGGIKFQQRYSDI